MLGFSNGQDDRSWANLVGPVEKTKRGFEPEYSWENIWSIKLTVCSNGWYRMTNENGQG